VVNNCLRRGLQALLDACFPQVCLLCGLYSGQPLPLCGECQAALPRNSRCCRRCALPLPGGPGTADPNLLCGNCLQQPPPWDSCTAPLCYDPQVALLLSRWKYAPDPRLGHLMTQLWLRLGPRELPPVDLVLPVPLHWTRWLRRGFNQAEQLAAGLQGQHPALAGARLDPARVSRRRAPAQASLDADARARNLRGAFTIRRPCANLRVAIVDDVLTTGTTAARLARCLQEAGAARMHIWCLARTPTPPART